MATDAAAFGPTISKEEIIALAMSLGVAAEFLDDAAINYFVTFGTDAAAALEPELLVEIAKGLTGAAPTEVLKAATTAAHQQAGQAVRGLVESELKAMNAVIKDGLEAGLHPRVVKRNLTMVRGLDETRAKTLTKYAGELAGRVPPLTDKRFQELIDRQHRILLNDRKETIARTEMAKAQGEGKMVRANARGDKFKRWITAGDDRVDDHCADNEAQGWIPLDKDFQSGVPQEPDHPNCRCSVTTRAQAPNEAANERVAADAARTAAAKEAA